MRILEPHLHMTSRTTDDYDALAAAGVEAVVEPSFWLGSARTHVATFHDYFRHLLEFEPRRAERHGLVHHASIAMNPKEANDLPLARAVVDSLGPFLDHPRCVAVGEVGFDQLTDAEEEVLRAQLRLAKARRLPVQVHLPHTRKPEGLRRTLDALKGEGFPMGMALLDHNTEETLGEALDAGCWAGMSIYPVTKLSPERAAALLAKHGHERVLLHSAADWGPSDPLAVPRTAALLRRKGMPRAVLQQLLWDNPRAFFAQGGKLGVPP